MRLLAILLATIAVLSAALADQPLTSLKSRDFACGSSMGDLHFLFQIRDKGIKCTGDRAIGFECTNTLGDRVRASCEDGCEATSGEAGCFATPERAWDFFRRFPPAVRVFSVTCRDADGVVQEQVELYPGREDTTCRLSKVANDQTLVGCGVLVIEKGIERWVENIQGRCHRGKGIANCGDETVDETGQRGCEQMDALSMMLQAPRNRSK
jgi:hypothetical protein